MFKSSDVAYLEPSKFNIILLLFGMGLGVQLKIKDFFKILR